MISEENLNTEFSSKVNEKIEEGVKNKQIIPTLSKKAMILLMMGLNLAVFIGALDNTIVSTALAVITSEFNALNEVTWIAASYLLTSTALQPLYGKLSDIFGRKYTILFALMFFLIGSIVCGASQDIITLIIFRAISGIGGGGLISLSIIIISDIVPMQTRGLYMGMVGAFYALASATGPLIGGGFTDGLTWRWAFYINIPVCIITITVIIFFLRVPTPKGGLIEKLKRIDYLGSFTLIAASTCLVLGLNWGGKDYTWNSAPVISTIVIGIIMFILFGIIEYKFAIEPIIPSHVLNLNIICANLVNFFNGFTFIVSIYYIPLYYQVAKGRTATFAGLELLPFLLGSVAGYVSSGMFATKTGKYRGLAMIGSFLALIGTILFGVLIREDITRAEEIIYALITGTGIGLCTQTNTIISQCSVEEKDVAVVTALINFTQSLGSVLGLAIQGSVFTNILANFIIEKIPDVDVALVTSSVEGLATLSSDQLAFVAQGYIIGFKYIYLSLIPFAAISFISSLFVKHIPFRALPDAPIGN